jgi:hypothetical protein
LSTVKLKDVGVPRLQTPSKIMATRALECQSEYESELNSNVGVDMLPNHGYTSGFTDGIHSNKQNINNNKNLNKDRIDEDRQIIEEAMYTYRKTSKGSLKAAS